MTKILRTLADLRVWRADRRGVGLVPTMGALHAGHRSLIERATNGNGEIVVSIFVNPAQFTNADDLARYPRDLDADAEIVAEAGGTAIYAPDASEMYPAGFATCVSVTGVTEDYEGEARPGHFDGVATVVTILLNQVRPDRSYFGEKDFQQLAMIRRMHRDLSLPGEIIECPTVRDHDGLALSSRNSRLSESGRQAALVLSSTLFAMRDHALDNLESPRRLTVMGAVLISANPAVALDYLEIVDPATLDPVDALAQGSRALVAATVDGVRVIDTIELIPR
ncbi:MAG: pantoate--beta-alanine ligase [Thermomicrobiales bacterium]